MNPTAFQILLALAKADAAAADIWRQVRADTSGTLIVAERTFYATLPALIKRGWIARQGEGRGGRYRLTPDGRRRLQWEAGRVSRAATLLRERL